MTEHPTLHQAIAAAKAGRKAEARRQFKQIIQTNRAMVINLKLPE